MHLKTAIAFFMFLVMSAPAGAQSWTPPSDAQRCPSKWGPNDQRGSANHMKPESVLRAVKLVRTGEVIDLAHVLRSDMPFSSGRRFEMHTKRTNMTSGSNRRGSNEEVMFTEIGQVGTQFDGFTHQTIGDSLYNCVKMDDVATRNGFTKLGIENVGALITRGVLIDVAALKGVAMLPDTYPITVDDLQRALQRQKVTLEPGDAIIINTGWGALWDKDGSRYLKTNPGLTTAAAEWLAKQDPMLIGMDTGPISVTPDPDPNLNNPVHQIALVVNGIHLLENLKLDELAGKQVYEFALIVQPLKIRGATGSTVTPIAIR
jgi:kynurenine formamidase